MPGDHPASTTRPLDPGQTHIEPVRRGYQNDWAPLENRSCRSAIVSMAFTPFGDGRQLKYASNFIAFAYPSIWVSRLIFLDNGSDFCNPNSDHTEITASGTKRFMIEQCGACRKNK